MQLSLYFSLGVISVLLAACGSSGSSSKETIAAPELAIARDGTRQLLTLINEARRKKRRPALQIDPRLILAARDHSGSMAEHHYFSHQGRDGQYFQTRMARRGYPQSTSGENLAISPDAVTTFNMWWESQGHRKNMMRKKFTRVGIFRTANYWTANFSAPDGT